MEPMQLSACVLKLCRASKAKIHHIHVICSRLPYYRLNPMSCDTTGHMVLMFFKLSMVIALYIVFHSTSTLCLFCSTSSKLKCQLLPKEEQHNATIIVLPSTFRTATVFYEHQLSWNIHPCPAKLNVAVKPPDVAPRAGLKPQMVVPVVDSASANDSGSALRRYKTQINVYHLQMTSQDLRSVQIYRCSTGPPLSPLRRRRAAMIKTSPNANVPRSHFLCFIYFVGC